MRCTQYLSYLSCSLFFLMAACSKEESPEQRRARELFTQAQLSLRAGNYHESRRLLRETLALCGWRENQLRGAEPSLMLGNLYSRAAHFDSAFVLLADAQELYGYEAYKDGVRAAVLARAHAHRVRGEYRKAFTILQEQIRLEEALGEKDGLRNLQWAMIPLCRILRNDEMEQRLLSELTEVYATSNDFPMLARVHRELGMFSLHRERYTDALGHFANALTVAQQANDSLLVIDLYQQRAIAYASLGKINESFVEFTAGLWRTDRTQGSEDLREEMMMRVGNIYLRRFDPERARTYFSRTLTSAIHRGKKLLEGYALLQLGHCAGTTQEAWEKYRAGAELLDSTHVPWARAYAAFCLGYAALRKNLVQEALTYLQRAAEYENACLAGRDKRDIYADCEHTFATRVGSTPTETLTELLFQLERPEEAFKHYETHKRAVLLNAYNDILPQTSSEKLAEGLRMFARVRGDYLGAVHRLAEAYDGPMKSESLAEEIRRVLEQASIRMKQTGDGLAAKHTRMSVLFSSQPMDIQTIQQFIPEGAAFVDYMAAPRTLYILLVTNRTVHTAIAPIGKARLEQLMDEYQYRVGVGISNDYEQRVSHAAARRTFRNPDATRIRELSGQLYSIFLRPVERTLPGTQRLYVALPLGMPLIGLHSLRPEGQQSTFALQRYRFRYCADAECLRFERSRLPVDPIVIGFGNPGGTRTDVEYEVRDTRVFFRGASLFLGNKATLATLRREPGQLLHAALDIRFSATEPWTSSVRFEEGLGYSGIRDVQLGELFDLVPYNTIVLSNLTLQGAHAAVARMFLMNGTSSLVMASPILPGRAKKRFNEIFYAELVRGVAADMAYRNALLYMLRDSKQVEPWFGDGFLLW